MRRPPWQRRAAPRPQPSRPLPALSADDLRALRVVAWWVHDTLRRGEDPGHLRGLVAQPKKARAA